MSKAVQDIKADELQHLRAAEAPILPYSPRAPRSYRPNIALIGCGGISASHLKVYRDAGYSVVALCDLIEERARSRRDEYFPDAIVATDYRELLTRSDIGVVDIATHPLDRVPIIEDAIMAGKHVLSQKPFVLDIAIGEKFVRLAEEKNVTLAVNHNGRWAPHFSYMREAVGAGLIGDVLGVHAQVHWDHTWTKDTPFEEIEDLILYDFAIHWFDFLASVIPNRRIERIYATKSRAKGQDIKVPMLAQAVIEFDGGQASLVFDGHTRCGGQNSTYIAGTQGSLSSSGPNLEEQTVQLFTGDTVATPELEGRWFTTGFHGAMSETLSSIEEQRAPLNNAKDNLRSLKIAFAAIASANVGRPFDYGEASRLWTPGGDIR